MRIAAVIALGGLLLALLGGCTGVYYCRVGMATKKETGEQVEIYKCSPTIEDLEQQPTPP
jgi:hypothetical protein